MKNRLCIAVTVCATVAVAVVCLYANLLEYGGQWQTWLSFLFASLVFVPFAVLFHEGGHILFGALAKIKTEPKFGIFRTSSCKLIPRTDQNLKARLVFTAAGGVAVNLLFVVLGVLALSVPAIPVLESHVLPSSLYFFLLNVLPLQLADGKTDGLVVWELLRGGDESKVMLAVLSVQAQVLGGKPIGEVDEKLLFDLPQIREDDESFIALTELRYEYCKAKGDEARAESYRARFEQLKKDYLDE